MRTQKRSVDLHYEACTIPPGMTAEQWRDRKIRIRKRTLLDKIRSRIQRGR